MERFKFSILMKVTSWERHHYDIEAQTIEEARNLAEECFLLSNGSELAGDFEFIESASGSEADWDWSASSTPIGPYYLYCEDDDGEHLIAEIDSDSDTISIMITQGGDNA